jgi:hypothetical protein
LKKLNVGQAITIVANLGVIAGIVFLSLEISQANRIAVHDARIDLAQRNYELQMSILENPEVSELMVKLMSNDDALTPQEKIQASGYATLLVVFAATINAALEDGLLTDAALGRHIGAVRNNIRRTPGIIPYLSQALELSQREGETPATVEEIFGELDWVD